MPKTILCVDDSVTMQKVAEITFRATDYDYVGARNADEGLSAAKNDRPALILADAVMPGKTGYDLCAAIKADPDLADVPVLMMCGNSQAYDPARGSEVGADGHVVKPWDTQVMLDKVEEVLGGGGAAASKPAPAAKPAPAPAPAPKPAPAPAARPAPAPAPKPAPAPAPAARPAPAPAPAAKPAPAPAPKPAPAAKPAPQQPRAAARPPSMPEPPEPPRSATIMGMPSLNLPPTKPGEPVPPPSFTPVAPPEAPKPEPAAARPEPAPAPRPSPAPPPAAKSGPAPVVAPVSSTPSGAIPTMPRPPMIKGTPTRRPNLSALPGGAAGSTPSAPSPAPVAAPAPAPAPQLDRAVAAATATAAADAARSAGLDPNGPEMAALLKLSRDVIERVVWEVVPELAETIIRENLDRLAAKAR